MADNLLVNPAVPNNTEVPTLLIEKFNGMVQKAYQGGENILSQFKIEEAVGTSMVSNKQMGDTRLQVLVPGTNPQGGQVEFNKNALIIDTIVLGRNRVNTLHDIQNDFDVMSELASNQAGKIRVLEDQMCLQQVAAGALTGGDYDPFANTITGGISRVEGHGVALNVELNDDLSQSQDPYQLVSAIEIALMGLMLQRVPVGSLRVVVPITEFSTLVDYKFVATTEGGNNAMDSSNPVALRGMLKSWNIPIVGSVEFSQMKLNPHDGETHHLLSNANNGNRYDVTTDMQVANALIYAPKALLCGRSIGLMSDIWWDKDTKDYKVDSWLAEGAIFDRYDNMAIVASTLSGDNAAVLTKATGKAKATKTYA